MPHKSRIIGELTLQKSAERRGCCNQQSLRTSSPSRATNPAAAKHGLESWLHLAPRHEQAEVVVAGFQNIFLTCAVLNLFHSSNRTNTEPFNITTCSAPSRGRRRLVQLTGLQPGRFLLRVCHFCLPKSFTLGALAETSENLSHFEPSSRSAKWMRFLGISRDGPRLACNPGKERSVQLLWAMEAFVVCCLHMPCMGAWESLPVSSVRMTR